MIEARTRSQQIADLLLEKIRTRSMRAGRVIDEAATALELGVSRTPLREAFTLLESRGLIAHAPNRSRRIREIDTVQVSHLYRIIGALERAALIQAEPPGTKELAALKRTLAGQRTGRAGLQRDRAFHEALCELSGNPFIVEARRQHADIALLFDGGSERGMIAAEQSAREHEAIIDALGRGAMAEAGDLVEAHWRKGAEAVAAIALEAAS